MDGEDRLAVIDLSPSGWEWITPRLFPGPWTADRPAAHTQSADFNATFS
jgi:hypothetical protein